jgi:hypothetical protein
MIGHHITSRTQAVIDGAWESVDTWHGIGDQMVGIGEPKLQLVVGVEMQMTPMQPEVSSVRSSVISPSRSMTRKEDAEVLTILT